MPINFEKISDSIGKSGFKLEFITGQQLKNNGWNLISNRCYIDDLAGTVREMDLLAYKVSTIYDISIYTTLIISCKKSETNSWALLSRSTDPKDPNYNWKPFKGWSNHLAINYYLSKKTWPADYNDLMSEKCPAIFGKPELDVFAFQEISKSNSTNQNDKNIFASITSLMKAQAYEMSILPERPKDKKRVYQFNLISIVDSELLRAYFEGEKITTSEIESEDYLCRYIVSQKEETARIKFVTAKNFPLILERYTELHSENCKTFEDHYAKFYTDAYMVAEKSKLLLPDLNRLAKHHVAYALFRQTRTMSPISDLSVYWNNRDKFLAIEVDSNNINFDLVGKLNSDNELNKVISSILEEVFHYRGKFEFELGIPF